MARDLEDIQKIEAFKKGYLPVLEGQITHAKAAQQLLTSSVFTPEEKKILSNTLPELDKLLSAIQTITRQLLMDLNPNNLQKDAGRDYHAFFKGDVLDHQLSYIVFFKTYVHLARYLKNLTETWKRIREMVTESRLSDASEFRKQLLHFRVGPVLNDIDALRTFVTRMGMVLQITRDPLTARDFAGAGKYREDIPYQLSTVFRDDLESHMTPAAADWDAMLSPGGTVSRAGSAAPVQAPPVGGSPYRLNAGGTQSWNTTAYYYFTYDPRTMEQERARLNNIVHIDMHMGADHNVMRSERILKYTRKLNQQEVHEDVEFEYTGFLHSFFNLVIEITTLNMGIPHKMRELFLFHLGPQSFYYLTRRFLQELDTGTIHRKSGRGSVMEKFVPAELVKKIILEWWQAHILSTVGMERDDAAQYRAITKMVKETYDRLSAKAMAEYDHLPESEKTGKNRAEIIRENLNKWLGPTNIIVFRRFLKSGTA